MVDDEPSVRQLVRDVLERGGFRALTTADGDQGLTLFAERRAEITAVLLDLTMPGKDGLEVLKILRETSDVPVLLMSGYTEEAVVRQSGDGRANGFIHKPFSPDELLARVCEVARAPSTGQ